MIVAVFSKKHTEQNTHPWNKSPLTLAMLLMLSDLQLCENYWQYFPTPGCPEKFVKLSVICTMVCWIEAGAGTLLDPFVIAKGVKQRYILAQTVLWTVLCSND